MATSQLTQDQLKSLLHYDPDTGHFTWNYTRPKCSKGTIAGGLCKDGYVMIGINYSIYRAHRLVWLYMTGAFPPAHIDHINGIRTDNRAVNIRLATPAQNQQNLKLRHDNASKHAGISWSKQHNRWYTYININGKRKFLGLYTELFDAVTARKTAEQIYHPYRPI